MHAHIDSISVERETNRIKLRKTKLASSDVPDKEQMTWFLPTAVMMPKIIMVIIPIPMKPANCMWNNT